MWRPRSKRRVASFFSSTSPGARKLRLEHLESRHLLAVTVAVMNDTEVLFTGDADDDTLVLSVTDTGLLQFEANGNSPTTDLDGVMLRVTDLGDPTPDLITRLTVDLGGGDNDSLTFARAGLPFVFSDPSIEVLISADTEMTHLETSLFVAPVAPGGSQLFQFGGSVVVPGEATVRANAIEFLGTIDGGTADLDADGRIDGNDLLTLLMNFSTPAGATVEMGDVDLDGDVDIDDLMRLLLFFGDSVGVTIETDQGVQFHGVVGDQMPLGELIVSGPTEFRITAMAPAAAAVATVGGQAYQGGVMLMEDTILASTGGGDITFGGMLMGLHALTVNTGGATAFLGPVIGLTSLTTGDQTYNDAVVLTADAALTGNNVLFAQTVNGDGAAGGPWALSVAAATSIRFGGNVGNLVPLRQLSVTGPTFIQSSSITTQSGQTYNNGVTLEQSIVLTSLESGDIRFADTVEGPHALTVNTGGTTIFEGAVTGLVSLTTDEPGQTDLNGQTITTTGDQMYNDDVVLTDDTVLTGEDITFAKTVNSDALGPWDLQITASGVTQFGGAVGNVEPLDVLTIDGPGETRINILVPAGTAAITTEGDQNYGEAVRMLLDATFVSMQGSITFAATVDTAAGSPAAGLTVNTPAGDNVFQNQVGVQNALRFLRTDDVAAPAGQTRFAVAATQVVTVQEQVYRDAVELAVTVTLASQSNGDIVFRGPVAGADGTQSLTVNTGGTTAFHGPVSDLVDLSTDADGQTDINGGTITTTGDQTYNDPVVLTDHTTLEGANVRFAQTVNGDGAAGGPWDLDVTGATSVQFIGNVGNLVPLGELDVTGLTFIQGNSVTTQQNQTYHSAVMLEADVVATSLQSGDIHFADTVEGPHALTVNTGGTTIFEAAVTGLVSLTTDAPGQTAINGQTITTSDNQTFNDAVMLGADAVLISMGDGDITFASTVMGPHMLDVRTGGITTFGGAVTGLASLRTDAPGQTHLGGGTVTTTGDQSFEDFVLLTADATLTSSAGNIVFSRSVNAADDGGATTSSAHGLVIDRQQGSVDTIFQGAVGDGGLAGSDPDGLASLTLVVNGPFRLIDVNGNADENDPDIQTVGAVDITVVEGAMADLTVATNVVLTSLLGNVTLRAGDDMTIEPLATLIAGAEAVLLPLPQLTLVIDSGSPADAAGGVFTALGAAGFLDGAGGVRILGGANDDLFRIQAERLRGGISHKIHGLAGDDVFEIVFAADGNVALAAGTTLLIDGGDGEDQTILNHALDTMPRVVRFQYTTADGRNVVVGGLGTANSALDLQVLPPTFMIDNMQDYQLRGAAAAGGHLQVRGVQTAVSNHIGVGAVGSPQTIDVTIPAHMRNKPVVQMVPAQTITIERRFEVDGYHCLHLIGGPGNDTLINDTALPSLIEGGDGNDILFGGSSVDVIFAGPGLDVLHGREGGDFLFADIALDFTVNGNGMIVPVAAPGSPFADPPNVDPADLIFGGPGLNHAAQIGTDLIAGITGMLLDGGGTKDIISWLRAQIMVLTPGSLAMLINNAFFGGNGKTGLADLGCDIEAFAIDRIPAQAQAALSPSPPQALAAASSPVATPGHSLDSVRDELFSDLAWLNVARAGGVLL